MNATELDAVLRFGRYELDLRTGELHRAGVRVRLQNQPFKVLAVLARRSGELVTRDELQRELWPDGTYVDFEQSLNFCVRQIRAALGDQAQTPRFVETLPRRGYRFIAPVEVVSRGVEPLGSPRPAEVDAVLSAAEPAEAELAPSEVGELPLPPESPVTPETARPAAVEAATSAPHRLVRPRWPALLATLLVLIVAAAGVAIAVHRTSPDVEPTFRRVTFRRGWVGSARFAPGGEVVYAAGWDGQRGALYSTEMSSHGEKPIGIQGEVVAVTSTGELLLRRQPRTLTRVPLQGGPEKPLLEDVLAADCTADGEQLAVARLVDGNVRLEFPIGHPLGSAMWPTHLRISRDGQRLAFLEHPVRNDDRGSVVVVERDGTRRVLSDGWASAEGLAWSPAGDEVWFTAARLGGDSGLHAVDLGGTVRTLVPGVGRLVLHDVAPDGRALVERNTQRIEAWFGAPDAPPRELSWLDATLVADLSPDGSQLLVCESGEGGGHDYSTFLRSTDGGPAVRIGPGRALAMDDAVSRVAAVPARSPDELHLIPTGPGETVVVRDAELSFYDFASFVPGGRRLLLTARSRSGPARSYVMDLADGSKRPVADPGTVVLQPTVTADGRFAVAASDDGWRLVALDGSMPPRPVPGLDEGRPVGWVGDDLVVREPGAAPARLVRLHPDGTREPWLEISSPDHVGLVGVAEILVTRDGRAWAWSQHRRWSDLYVVEGLGQG